MNSTQFNNKSSKAREEFFNRIEIEQDAMALRFINQINSGKSINSRSRNSQYRCNKRVDNSNNDSCLLRTNHQSKRSTKGSPLRRANIRDGCTRRPVSSATETIYPVNGSYFTHT